MSSAAPAMAFGQSSLIEAEVSRRLDPDKSERACANAPDVSVTVSRFRTAAAIDVLGEAWRGLEESARLACFFSSFGWCRTVLARLGGSGPDALEAIVVTCRREGRLVALWPLAIQRKAGVRVITSLAAPFDQYAELLVAEGEDADAMLRRLSHAVREAVPADAMVLRKARRSGIAIGLAALGARIVDQGQQAPYLDLDTAAPFEAFLSTVTAKTRKNLRNAANRLAKLGSLTHRVLEGESAREAIAASFGQRRRSLDEQGLSSEAFRDQRFAALVDGLGEAGAISPVVFRLELDGRAIATQWGFVHRGCYTAYISSRDPEFEPYSAGRLHLQHVIQECHRRGIGRVDLLVPAVPYKLTWARDVESVADIVWPWTFAGHIAVGFVERRVRPAVKRAIAGLPIGLRQGVLAALMLCGRVRGLGQSGCSHE